MVVALLFSFKMRCYETNLSISIGKIDQHFDTRSYHVIFRRKQKSERERNRGNRLRVFERFGWWKMNGHCAHKTWIFSVYSWNDGMHRLKSVADECNQHFPIAHFSTKSTDRDMLRFQLMPRWFCFSSLSIALPSSQFWKKIRHSTFHSPEIVSAFDCCHCVNSLVLRFWYYAWYVYYWVC